MKPDRFPLGLICGVLLSVAGYLAWANKSDWDTSAGVDIEPQSYTFTVPPMVLGCIPVDVQSNSEWKDWQLDQWVVFYIVNVHDVTMDHIKWSLNALPPTMFSCRPDDTSENPPAVDIEPDNYGAKLDMEWNDETLFREWIEQHKDGPLCDKDSPLQIAPGICRLPTAEEMKR